MSSPTITEAAAPSRRVGVYVDAFNLYYGMKSQFEGDQSARVRGWRWLDLVKLSQIYAQWGGSEISRIVYCTAKLNDPTRQQSAVNQAVYIEALSHSGVEVELGKYTSRAKEKIVTGASLGEHSPQPLLDPAGHFEWNFGDHSEVIRRRAADGMMFARVRLREEKGSDVNVATHLLRDVYTDVVDSVIVITNDSDLALPIALARERVSVGLINPQLMPLAGDLKGDKDSGAGGHWWRRLSKAHVQESQLPVEYGGISKPETW